MPIYQITRDVPGWTQAELHAAAIRTQTCAAWFEGMEWIRSFHHPETGTLTCYYVAESDADLRRHAEFSDVPCDEVRAVDEYLPMPADQFEPDKTLTSTR